MPPTSPAALAAAQHSVGGMPSATPSNAATRHRDRPSSSAAAPKFGTAPVLDGGFGKISMLVSVTSELILVTSEPILVTSAFFFVAVSEKVCSFAPSSEAEIGT